MYAKKVEITPEQMTRALHEVTTGERLKPLMAKAPVLSIAFSLFGAELIKVLFDKEENNE